MKILILSYHFPPFNVIASYRAKAYADFLPKFGVQTTLITHPWIDSEPQVIDELHNSTRVIRIPRRKSWRYSIIQFINKVPLLRVMVNYLVIFLGFLDGNNINLDYYFLYKKFLTGHLKNQPYDLILAVCSPYHHIRLANLMNKQYGIPFAIDFRDLYDNRALSTSFNPNLNERIQNFGRKLYLRKWINASKFVVSTSQEWADYMGGLGEKPGIEVLNGYEEEYFDQYKRLKSDFFEISSVGTLHESQDWNSYFEALDTFLKIKADKVKINFVGLNSASLNRVQSWSSKYTGSNIYIDLKPRLSKEIVFKYFERSSVLLLPTLVGNVGMYSGKTAELIATRIPIIAFPDDGGVICQLLNSTQSGFALTATRQIVQKLCGLYEIWENEGIVESNISMKDVEYLSRENQVKRLANYMLKVNGKD